MKRFFLSFVIAVLMPCLLMAQSGIPVSFDERVDLLSVVWHLAGAKEYNECPIETYIQDVDQHFGRFKNHTAIKYAKQYYHNGTGYDAVAEFAIHTKIADGRVVLDDDLVPGFDDRWTESMRAEFIVALNDFYLQSRFHDWFESTKNLQVDAEKAFQPIVNMVDLEWYSTFFKKQNANFQIVLCPLAGHNNYGVGVQKKDGVHVLEPVISSTYYKEGQITYDINRVFPIVIHEFCHAYCNPLIDEWYDQMKANADVVFEHNRAVLTGQAYTNSRIMMYESFVRASVIRYMQTHFTSEQVDIEALIKEEEHKGFIMIRTLIAALAEYDTHKDTYPDMVSYMPQLVRVINGFSVQKYLNDIAEADKNKAQYECNVKDGAVDVPSGDFVFTITFDRPMQDGISMNMTDVDFPKFNGYSWSEDAKTIYVKFFMLPVHDYGFQIVGDKFVGKDGVPAVDRTIRFRTAK